MKIEYIWERIVHWLSLRPFGGSITLFHIVLGLFLLWLLQKLLSRWVFAKQDRAILSTKVMQCGHCGWKGQLQVHIRRCPNCNHESMHLHT